jgi:signal transduction histidine kinase
VVVANTMQESASAMALTLEDLFASRILEEAEELGLTHDSLRPIAADLMRTLEQAGVVGVKIWGPDGQILYSEDSSLIGMVFDDFPERRQAWAGAVSWQVSDLEGVAHAALRQDHDRLLELFFPVHPHSRDTTVAVAEVYYPLDDLDERLASSRRSTWLLMAAIGLPMYGLLAVSVRSACNTIRRQERDLARQVTELTALLDQNTELQRRARGAAASATAANEQFRRRISSEIHDGPLQEVGFALLQLDRLEATHVECVADGADRCEWEERIEDTRFALRVAVNELRQLSRGMAGVALEDLSIDEVVRTVVDRHAAQSGTPVHLEVGELPTEASLATKITLFRIIQESLRNTVQHADDTNQSVRVWVEDSRLCCEIADDGPGFDPAEAMARDDRLGLAGMRDRCTILGGQFRIDSGPDRGTTVTACLPLAPGGEEHVL